MKKICLCVLLLLATAVTGLAETGEHLLLQRPAVSQTAVAFVFAGDLWVVGREGGEARRLTTGTGIEINPYFSPDGTMIAFTGQYDGNTDVYVMPSSGGVPRRLTWHPLPDVVTGWTPDGKQVLFRSYRDCPISRQPYARLYTLAVDGVFPTALPLPMGYEGSYSANGARMAYEPLSRPFAQWKRYRGGRTTKICLADLADSRVEEIPRNNSNDFNPMWVGGKIYFLSDREGPVSLFAYDIASKKITTVVRNGGLDIKSASAGPGAIVYEQFGSLYLFDLNSSNAKKLDVRITADLPSVRPRFEKAADFISNYGLSPTGARAVFEARGEILTVPSEKGNARNLTGSPGVMERDPAWSPDGKWIAYFSDESGEYALHLRDQSGMGEVKKINLGNPPSFYYSPIWSPDSRKVAYRDKRLNVWYVDIEKGSPVKVDTDTYENPFVFMSPAWSPDSRWITYAKQLKNHLRAVFIYSLDTGKANQITDGMSDALYPAFDRAGKYLYFTASTDIGPTTGWIDLSGQPHQVTRNVYAVVLSKDQTSPLAPESDEEKVEQARGDGAQKGETQKAAPKKEPLSVAIDFADIDQRIIALPIPARNFIALVCGKSGVIYLLEALPDVTGATGATLSRFDLDKRKFDKVIDGVNGFDMSADGEKMLLRQGQRFTIAATSQPLRPAEGALNINDLEVWVDPRAEWKQMYYEVWRIQRDYFYDPGLHGLDLQAAIKKYEPFLNTIAHRADLSYLFQEMLGNMTVGHHNTSGGQLPRPSEVSVGLLGCDYKIEGGRYRFNRVYSGESWTPQLRAPLTQPGVNVKAGEYLLAVNGRELHATDNIYSFFENTAGKSVVIKVGADPTGANSREVTVIPLANELLIRNRAWVEDNRRKVDQMSGGRVAYVYVPDTAALGYTSFNRYFFSQVDKGAAIIDERFNGGGAAADYIIDYLRRPLLNYFTTREGANFTTPVGAIYGPKAMIINEYSSSGGDALPFYFRETNIGPLVGKRTWGGLVGIYGEPVLMDGGQVTAPRVAFFSPKGEWEVENRGVAPDIEVDLDPQAWRAGRDPQLEKAVEVVMETLRKNPLPAAGKPAYPNYHRSQAQQ
jgi:tricorn protease